MSDGPNGQCATVGTRAAAAAAAAIVNNININKPAISSGSVRRSRLPATGIGRDANDRQALPGASYI